MGVGFAGSEKPLCLWLENALCRPTYYPTMSDSFCRAGLFSGCSCGSVAFELRWTARREAAAKSKASDWGTAPAVGVDSSGSLHDGCWVDANWEHISKSMFAGTAKWSVAYLCILYNSFIQVHVCASFQVLQSTGSPLVNSQLFFLDLVLVIWTLKNRRICDNLRLIAALSCPYMSLSYLISLLL